MDGLRPAASTERCNMPSAWQQHCCATWHEACTSLEVSCGHSIGRALLCRMREQGQVDVLTAATCGEAHIDGNQCWPAAGDARCASSAGGSRWWHAGSSAATCKRAGEDGAHRLGKCGAVRRSAWIHSTRKLIRHQGHAAAPFGGARATEPESRRSGPEKLVSARFCYAFPSVGKG